MEPAGILGSSSPRFTRRTAVKVGTVSLAGLATGAGTSAVLTHLGPPGSAAWRFFSDADAALVIELCEQIIPRDDTPGATDAGVIFFLDRQLAGTLARHAGAYRAGIAGIRASCQEHAGVSFEKLSTEDKIAFLKLVESGQAPAQAWAKEDQMSFFRLLVDHTMQAFYGSPRHGGNRGYVSYQILGIDYPQIIGQNRQEGSDP